MKKRIILSLYWKCQLTGWTVAALYWEFNGFISGNFNWALGVLQFITDMLICILITHLYRNFALRHSFQNLNLGQLLKRIIPAAIILGIAYTLATTFKLHILRTYFFTSFSEDYPHFFKENAQVIFIGGVRLMSIWLLAYHMYQYAQREIRTNHENARLAIITRDAQLNNLSAQLNPHFLFNSLNNIKALVVENPKSARRAIDLLSDILRTSLYTGEIMLVSLQDEINLIKDYLELEKLRFEERLQYNIHIADGLVSVRIPRLCIQTLVENAVKHGIAKIKDGGLITVKVERSASAIQISVQNPGKLQILENEYGVGLKNLKERLQLQYKGTARFTISGELHYIVSAIITLPSA